MKVNNYKSIARVSVKNLLMTKMRCVITVIAIALTTILFTSLFTILMTMAKGFEDCVAVMNGNQINVVVKSEGELQTAQIAQINAIVYEQAGILPSGVTIIRK